MKKLTIGRNNTCDIIIPDTSDLVSRKQAVLAYYFLGKMVLYDTSNNGTYVNGQQLENGKGKRVTRKDKVNFARIADLNWDEVKDPYRKAKMFIAISSAILIIGILAMPFWLSQSKKTVSSPVNTEISTPTGETFTTVDPQPVKEQSNQSSKRKSKKNIKGKSITPEDIINKEVNENSPIVY